MRWILTSVTLAVSAVLAGLVAQVAFQGWAALTPEFLFALPVRAGREGGILPVLVSTGLLVGGALAAAVPVGVGAAVYLTEFSPGGRLVASLRALIDALAGVPSILFGLFGFSLFVVRLGWGWSLLSGAATLALMLLPVLIRTAEEALKTVPAEIREAAAALGATPEQVAARVALPWALPAILSGTILSLGRALGETAAVLLTAGSSLLLPASLLDPGRPLAVHLYQLASEGLSDSRSYAAALVLLLSVLGVNLLAGAVLHRLRRR